MAIQKLQPAFKFNEEQIKQLKQIAPEAFRDNTLDFNILYESLAENISDDEFENEHYGLNWPGKKKSKIAASLKPISSLSFTPSLSHLSDTTNNIFL